MQTTSQLQMLLEEYRRLCQEIEWLKHRIVGGRYPVESRRWRAWKAKQARKRQVKENVIDPAELSDDPHYQHLLTLDDQLNCVWFEIVDGDSYETEENFLRDVALSFPSLHEVFDPCLSAMSVGAILATSESVNPQAYHAALFVHTLKCMMHQWKSDPPFFIDRAFEVWDNAHKEAFARWVGMPCFPANEFRRLSVDPPSV